MKEFPKPLYFKITIKNLKVKFKTSKYCTINRLTIINKYFVVFIHNCKNIVFLHLIKKVLQAGVEPATFYLKFIF